MGLRPERNNLKTFGTTVYVLTHPTLYVCIMLASTHRRAGSGWRESSTCWFPRVLALRSFPPPRARPTTRPNLYNVRSYRWLRLGLSFVYFYVYRRASARYARPHQSSEASQQQPIQRATTPRVATCPPARYYRALAGCFGWRARQKTAVFQLPWSMILMEASSWVVPSSVCIRQLTRSHLSSAKFWRRFFDKKNFFFGVVFIFSVFVVF